MERLDPFDTELFKGSVAVLLASALPSFLLANDSDTVGAAAVYTPTVDVASDEGDRAPIGTDVPSVKPFVRSGMVTARLGVPAEEMCWMFLRRLASAGEDCKQDVDGTSSLSVEAVELSRVAKRSPGAVRESSVTKCTPRCVAEESTLREAEVESGKASSDDGERLSGLACSASAPVDTTAGLTLYWIGTGSSIRGSVIRGANGIASRISCSLASASRISCS